MAWLYFLLLGAFATAAYFVMRTRAAGLAGGAELHSRPVYHGLFAAALIAVPMIAVYAIAWTFAAGFIERQSLAAMDPALLEDSLRRGAAYREIRELAAGRHSGQPSLALEAGASTYRFLYNAAQIVIYGLGISAGLAGFLYAFRSATASFRARNRFERFVQIVLLVCAAIAVLTTIGIVFSVAFETFRFFFDPNLKGKPTVSEFLFGTQWSPQTAIRADQGGSSGSFGIVPLVAGTLLISTIAILVAGPIGLLAAIYMAEYATPRFRAWVKPVLEILAGIPTVVLGFFAALTVAPLIRGMGEAQWGKATFSFLFLFLSIYAVTLIVIAALRLAQSNAGPVKQVHRLGVSIAVLAGLFAVIRQYSASPIFDISVASESALAAGLVMGMMIIPFVSSLSDDVITAVPQSLRDGSYAMGATPSETIRQVVLPAALPGIVSAFMLAISRAIGETMIVVMAAGLAANLTANPLEAVTTFTVQIKTILVGDQEFDSAKTLAAFALGFVLFFFTLTLNVIALAIVRKYREQYD